MRLHPNFVPVKLPQYNMLTVSFPAGSLKDMPKNIISNVVDAADRMKGKRIIVDYRSKDIYPLLVAAGIYHDRTSEECAASSDELWGQVETDDEDEFIFEDDDNDNDITNIDEVRNLLSNGDSLLKYKGICLLKESELECTNEQNTAGMVQMMTLGDELLDKTRAIREGDGTTVIMCSTLGGKLMRLLENCGSSATIILAVDISRVNYEQIKRLKFDFGFTEAGKLDSPTCSEYTEMLLDILHSSGVNVSAESAAANVQELIRYRRTGFSGLDVSRYAEYICSDNVDCLSAEDFVYRFGVKCDEHTIDELDKITGCDKAKKTLSNIVMEAVLCSRMEKESGKKVVAHNNIIFTGNPGVGKTMMARKFAEILASAGVTNGSFVEIGKDDMMGQFLGQTEQKLSKILSEAAGGVLFIDEASSLLTSDDRDIYASSIVSMLVRFMENCPETIVIFATYPNEGEKLLSLDSGLRSRIPHQVAFEDYTAEQLSEIFVKMANSDGFTVDNGSKSVTTPFFEKALKNFAATFGNARAARNLYETARKVHAARCYKDSALPLTRITRKDVAEAVKATAEQMFGVCSVARPIGF